MIGGSAVGVELGQFLASMGAQVTLVQRGSRLLDREDPRVGELAAAQLGKDGLDIRTGTQVTAVHPDNRGSRVDLDDGSTVVADVIVLGTGRRPHLAGLGLDTVSVTPTQCGAVPVDEPVVSPLTGCGPSATSPVSRCSPTSPCIRPAWSPTPSSAHPGERTTPVSRAWCSPTLKSLPSA